MLVDVDFKLSFDQSVSLKDKINFSMKNPGRILELTVVESLETIDTFDFKFNN